MPSERMGGPDGEQCLLLTGVNYDRLDRSCLPGIGPGELTLTMLGTCSALPAPPLTFSGWKNPHRTPTPLFGRYSPGSLSSLFPTSKV